MRRSRWSRGSMLAAYKMKTGPQARFRNISLALARRAGAGLALALLLRLVLLVLLQRVGDLLLGGLGVLLGHGAQVLAARELVVVIGVLLVEVLARLGVAHGLALRDRAVLVLVERLEARVALVLADLIGGVDRADSERERSRDQEKQRLG